METTKEPTWEEAIVTVLAEADGAMHYTDITQSILVAGMRANPGANPAATVRSAIYGMLARPDGPIQRVAPGQYMLRDRVFTSPPTTVAAGADEEPASEAGAIQAFGMYWQRSQVNWARGRPALLGRQGVGAETVDFADQIGVYLLHDRDRVIYVGRAADCLHTRLRVHTVDRLAGRWDRFSWFGLRDVLADGRLSDASPAWSHLVVIETLEALLIESLEPPLNRKRGDNFAAVEFLQVEDPEIDATRRKGVVLELMKAAGMPD